MAHAVAESQNRAETMISTVLDGVHNVYLASLGVVASTQEKTREVFDELIDKGKGYEKDSSKLLSRATHEAKEFGQQFEERVQRTVSATLNRAGVPSRDEIHGLIQRLEVLTEKVDKLASK